MKNPHAQALGALGGKVKSEKKRKAVTENAKKATTARMLKRAQATPDIPTPDHT